MWNWKKCRYLSIGTGRRQVSPFEEERDLRTGKVRNPKLVFDKCNLQNVEGCDHCHYEFIYGVGSKEECGTYKSHRLNKREEKKFVRSESAYDV